MKDSVKKFSKILNSYNRVSDESRNLYNSGNPLEIVASQKATKRFDNFELNGKKISSIVVTMRPHLLEQVYNTFEKQIYENKELILVLNRADFSASNALKKMRNDSRIKILEKADNLNLGALFSLGIKSSSGEIIAKMDDDDEYGAAYLRDSVQPILKGKSRISGKTSSFVFFEQENALYLLRPGFANNDSVKKISGSSFVFEKKLVEQVGWPDLPLGEDNEFLRRLDIMDEKISSTDTFSYLIIRRGDVSSHTWKSTSEKIKMSSVYIGKGKNEELILSS